MSDIATIRSKDKVFNESKKSQDHSNVPMEKMAAPLKNDMIETEEEKDEELDEIQEFDFYT